MKNLIDKVKPEVLEILDNDVKINYNCSYRYIITSLHLRRDYRVLSISEVTNLIAFLSPKFQPVNSMDWQWCDYLLQKKYQI